MLGIRKDYNLKVVLFFTAVLVFLNTAAYAINLSSKTHLRVPSLLDVEDNEDRIEGAVAASNSSITQERKKELKKLVPKLTKELGRAPSVSEVAERMETIKSPTRALKIAAFNTWIVKNEIDVGSFGIQKHSRSTDKPLQKSFRFAGAKITIGDKLGGKVRVQQTTAPRSELKELVLEGVDKPHVQLKLVDLKNVIKIVFKKPDDAKIERRITKNDQQTIDISSLSSFIAFRDSILDIPLEFGLKRKAALMKWLKMKGIREERTKTSRNITMMGDIFFLPSWYRERGDRIVLYKDSNIYIKLIALVEKESDEAENKLKNPTNFCILEYRDGRFFWARTGEELVHVSKVKDKNKRVGLYDLSKYIGFKRFNHALNKKINREILTDVHNLMHIGFIQGKLTFWSDMPLEVTSIDKKRAHGQKGDRQRYPIILTRDDGKHIFIRSYHKSADEFTVSGLNFNDGKPVILKGTYLNISVILEMIRMRIFEDFITTATVDPMLFETFRYRENEIATGQLNPIKPYLLNPETGVIEAGEGLIHPSELPLVDMFTAEVPGGSILHSKLRLLKSGTTNQI